MGEGMRKTRRGKKKGIDWGWDGEMNGFCR